MPLDEIEFCVVPECRKSNHRVVGFLKGDKELDAESAFQSLKGNKQYFFRSSVDCWVDGSPDITTRFHGFVNDSEYPMCFVFKVKDNRQGHRFYGYLYHPQPKTKPNFLLCVLCVHAMKHEKETDRGELRAVHAWYKSERAREAIRKIYVDGKETQEPKRKGPPLWTN